MKKIGCLLLSVFLIVSCAVCSVAAESTDIQSASGTKVPSGFMKVCENKYLELYVNTETAVILTADKNGHRSWSTIPDTSLIRNSTESIRIQLLSQLRVSFLDESRNLVTVTSFDQCTAQGNYSIKTVKKNGKVIGVKTVYDFKENSQRFKIPVRVCLQGNALTAEILFDEISEYGTSQVCYIDLFPFFSAAGGEEQGYLFIPDGSGALVDFSKRYRNAGDYSGSVYGSDPSVNVNVKQTETPIGISMPCFGMKKGDGAFFAVIGQADALAKIQATSAKNRFDVSAVCASFCYRECDETGLVDGDRLLRSVRMADTVPSNVNPFVTYRFLSGTDADYNGMARLYRNDLIEKYGLKPLSETEKTAAPFLEIFGKTSRKATFLGIPYRKNVCATAFDDVAKMYRALQKDGVEQCTLALYGFSKGGFERNHTVKQTFDSAVGGKRGFRALLKQTGDTPIFLCCDLMRDYDAASRFFKGKGYIQSMNRLTVVREEGALSTAASAGLSRWLLLSGDRIVKNADRFLRSLPKAEKYGILYQNLGSDLYGNFSETQPENRQEILSDCTSVVKSTRKTARNVAADGANVYLLAGAGLLSEVPLGSGDQAIFTETIPFYFMVLNGYVRLASRSLNEEPNLAAALSECLQYGVMPTFRITECSADQLRETNLRFLYNSKFADWKETIVQAGTLAKEYAAAVGDACITSYEREGEISIVRYENGVRIALNKGQESAVYRGMTLESGQAQIIASNG